MKGQCVDVWGVHVFVSEGELYSTGLLGAGGPDSTSWAASVTAEISPRVACSATEMAPSLRGERL